MAEPAMSTKTAADAAAASRLEIRMIVLSVGRCPVFSSSRTPISAGASASGCGDIRTLFL
jgi:hypothetical protein